MLKERTAEWVQNTKTLADLMHFTNMMSASKELSSFASLAPDHAPALDHAPASSATAAPAAPATPAAFADPVSPAAPTALKRYADDGAGRVIVDCVGRGGTDQVVRFRLTGLFDKWRKDLASNPGGLYFCTTLYFTDERGFLCPLPNCLASYPVTERRGKHGAGATFRHHLANHFSGGMSRVEWSELPCKPIFLTGLPVDKDTTSELLGRS